MGNRQSLEDHLFNLRLTSKQLVRESKKSEQSAAANKLKCKKAMEVGNVDGARIYAESAIRDQNGALNYLRLASRIDAVAQRVNTAVKTQRLTTDMSGIVKGMDAALKSMNVEKIAAVMDSFEEQFKELDLTTAVMESSMQQSTTMSMPENQVETLMKQVADQHGLEFQNVLAGLPQASTAQNKDIATNAVAPKPQVVQVAASSSTAGGRKPGDDGAAGGGGSMAASSSSSSSSSGASVDDRDLEERLRRLENM